MEAFEADVLCNDGILKCADYYCDEGIGSYYIDALLLPRIIAIAKPLWIYFDD